MSHNTNAWGQFMTFNKFTHNPPTGGRRRRRRQSRRHRLSPKPNHSHPGVLTNQQLAKPDPMSLLLPLLHGHKARLGYSKHAVIDRISKPPPLVLNAVGGYLPFFLSLSLSLSLLIARPMAEANFAAI